MTASRSITSHRKSQPPCVWWVNVYRGEQHLFLNKLLAHRTREDAVEFSVGAQAYSGADNLLYRLRITEKEPRG